MTEKPAGQFKLELVDEDSAPSPTQSRLEGHAADVLLLALKALSQRALVALASLFSLLTVAAVFWLALSISANPTIYQIATLGIFSAFVIVINYIVRRGR
jgi:hypothetical protein